MSLSSALDIAKSSIAASTAQTSVISRNIANLDTVGATRKYANVVTGAGGRVEVRSIAQSSNSVLFRNMLDANASVGRWNAITGGLNRIEETIGDTTLGRSPSALISALGDALHSLAATPNNFELARSAADAARDLAANLNAATATVQTVRQDADKGLADAAADMNALLATIEDLNRRVVGGTRAGTDVTDLSDKRDQAVTALSKYVGITTRTRADNDLVLYTDSGVTVFETRARPVEFDPTPGLDATLTQGSPFRIDGTAVTGDTSFMPLRSGAVYGLVALRDDLTVTYQTQLDEVARGLVEAFAETEQPGGANPLAGLFRDGASTALPTGVTRGLAGRLQVAASVVSDPTLIRDGGINGASYLYNVPVGGNRPAGFTARINGLVTALGADRTYDPQTDADTAGSLADFAASSLSWLQARRSASTAEGEYKTTLFERTQETLSNETGINMEEQMSLLIQIERSYQASAKLISTIDDMLATLIQSI